MEQEYGTTNHHKAEVAFRVAQSFARLTLPGFSKGRVAAIYSELAGLMEPDPRPQPEPERTVEVHYALDCMGGYLKDDEIAGYVSGLETERDELLWVIMAVEERFGKEGVSQNDEVYAPVRTALAKTKRDLLALKSQLRDASSP